MSNNPLRFPSPASSPKQPSSLRHEYAYQHEPEEQDQLARSDRNASQARAALPRPGISTVANKRRFDSLLRRAFSNLFRSSPSVPPESPKDVITDGTVASAGSRRDLTFAAGISIPCFDISPDRSRAILAGRDLFRILEVDGKECKQELDILEAVKHSTTANRLAQRRTLAAERERLSIKDVKWAHGPFDKKIVTAAANGQIFIYDLADGAQEWIHLHQHHRQVHTLGVTALESSLLLSGSQDATVRLWDLRDLSGAKGGQTMASRVCFHGNSDAVRDVQWSPEAAFYYAIGTDSGTVQKWDIRKHNAPVLRVRAHEKACNAVDWHPLGRHILSAGSDKDLKIWDFSSSERRIKPQLSFRAPQAIFNARWRPGCERVRLSATGGWEDIQIATSFDKEDPQILFWDVKNPYVPTRAFNQYDLPPSSIIWHSEKILWSVGDHGIFTQTIISDLPARRTRQPPKVLLAAFPDNSILHITNNIPIADFENKKSSESAIVSSGKEQKPAQFDNRRTMDQAALIHELFDFSGRTHMSPLAAQVLRLPEIMVDVKALELLALGLKPVPKPTSDEISGGFHEEFFTIMQQNAATARNAGIYLRDGLAWHFDNFAECGQSQLLERAKIQRSSRANGADETAFQPADYQPVAIGDSENCAIGMGDLCYEIVDDPYDSHPLVLRAYIYLNILPWFPIMRDGFYDDDDARFRTVWAYQKQLYDLGLFIAASAVSQEWQLVRTNSKQNLGYNDGQVASYRCNTCKKRLRSSPFCEKCEKAPFTCGWCRKTIDSLFVLCQKCGHYMHLNCWEKKSATFTSPKHLGCSWPKCGCDCAPEGKRFPTEKAGASKGCQDGL